MFNAFITAGGQGKHGWPRTLVVLAITILLTIAASAAVQILALAPLMRAHDEMLEPYQGVIIALYLGLLFAFAGGILAVLTKAVHKRPILSLITARPNISWTAIAFGGAAWASAMLILTAVFAPGDLEPAPFLGDPAIAVGLVAVVLIGFLIQGGGEEILFRGYLPQILNRWIKARWLALALPAPVFALLHGGYGFEPFLYSLVVALVMALAVALTGRLEEAIGAHAANNAVVLLLYGSPTENFANQGWSFDATNLLMALAAAMIWLLALVVYHRLARYRQLTSTSTRID